MLPPMLKRHCNTTMTKKKRTYESKINQVTDQLEESTIGQGKPNEKVLFFADPHFLFLITPDAHLAHCLLPSNTQTKQKGKSQRAKLPTHLNNRLISKDVFYSIKGNQLVTL
jgi:hypothetical protein